MTDKDQGSYYLEEPEKSIDFKYYFFLLKKNFFILLTFFIIGVTLSSIYVSKLPNVYEATAQVIIERPKTPMAQSENRSDDSSPEGWTEDYYNTQIEIMRGPTVIRQVIGELKLMNDFEDEDIDAIEDRLREMLVVQRIRGSRLFNIVVKNQDPELAANLANAIARAYIRKNFEDSLYYSKEILAWLPQEGKSDTISIQDPFGNVKQITREELIESLPSIQTDATIRTLREKKSSLEAELQVLLRQYREKHPVIIKSRAQLKFLDESIKAEKQRIIEGLKTQAEGTLQSSYGRVSEEAALPKTPIGPNRLKLILIAVLGEILLSVIIIFLFDYFDDTIHSLEDLDRKGILLPFLGPVPLLKAKGHKDEQQKVLVAYYDRDSDITESFRYLRVAINFSASPESLKNLVITSCLSHEGKSFVSHNTAISLAMDGNKTLLVDGDLRRPVVHRNFRMDNTTGLSNYLTSKVEFDSVVKESFVENLMIVTSGPVSPNPAEILGSQRMKDFLEEARRRFDRIIIDCPPLTAIGDGYVVGHLIGHVMLVIAANRTPADLIKRTQAQLEKAGIKILGVILNQVNMDKERLGGYSKHYYHTYNRYYRRAGNE